jgi:hypothetical protein
MKRLTNNQINLLLLAAQIVIILSVWRLLPPEIPLFYSRPWGKDQLVIFPGILLLPLISFFVFLANLMISRATAREERLIKKTLTTTSLLFASLSLIALVQIVRLIL